MSAPRLLIIGLDCAEPELVFERWRDELPNLAGLIARGSSGRLESCIPAITVPAWSCMLSGRDPGELGIYGFRNRIDRSYGRMSIADGRSVRVPRLWDLLGAAGWRVALIGVPGTYPPPAVNGVAVSCFLAPNTVATYTYPPSFARQIDQLLGEYLLDVPQFRSGDKDRILRDIYQLCDQRFALAHHMLDQQRPDLLMLVDMGVDRIQHAFWKHMDPRHPQFVPDSPYAGAIRAYYRHVDAQIGGLLERRDDRTSVLVVSDHGARPLMGGFRLNEWLRRSGDLVLEHEPVEERPLEDVPVNWSRTSAWGAGGYYGRVFLNVRGREPHGTIAPAAYNRARAELAERLAALPGPDGASLGNRVFVPQQIYRRVRGIAPDLIVYFGDLAWRSVGTVGGDAGLYVQDNDTGPDDANHAQHGLLIFHDPQQPGGGRVLGNLSIYDILPTLLARYDIAAPEGLRGTVRDL